MYNSDVHVTRDHLKNLGHPTPTVPSESPAFGLPITPPPRTSPARSLPLLFTQPPCQLVAFSLNRPLVVIILVH